MSVGDSIRLLQLMGTAVERDTMAVGVEYHGGLGGMGGKNAIVIGVKIEGCPRGHMGSGFVKQPFEILNKGVVHQFNKSSRILSLNGFNTASKFEQINIFATTTVKMLLETSTICTTGNTTESRSMKIMITITIVHSS